MISPTLRSTLRDAIYQPLDLLRTLEFQGTGGNCVCCEAEATEAHDRICWVGQAMDAMDTAVTMLDELRPSSTFTKVTT